MNVEQHQIARIDLKSIIQKLSHRDLMLLVLRNVMGLSWSEISGLTGKDWRECRRDFKLALHFLALWLRAYYGPAGLSKSRLRLRSAHRQSGCFLTTDTEQHNRSPRSLRSARVAMGR